jgi:hypothetical protein
MHKHGTGTDRCIPAPRKLNYLSKRSLLLGEFFFNNLPREIKNVTDQLKKFKTAL